MQFALMRSALARCLVVSAWINVGLTTTAFGQLPFEHLTHWGGEVRLLHREGNHAFVGLGPNLHILDVSDPDNPTQISETYVEGLLHGIAIDGNTAYVVPLCGEMGLHVYDISDLSDPVLIGGLDDTHCNPGLYAPLYSDGVLYVGTGEGVNTYDATDPTDLMLQHELSDCTVPGCWGVIHTIVNDGAILYMADHDYVRTVNATDPLAPQHLSSFRVGNVTIEGFEKVDNQVFLASDARNIWSYAFVVLNVSDPANMFIIGEYANNNAYHDVAISGSLAYVAAGLEGLLVLDVSDPANITQVGVMPSESGISRITVWGSTGYINERDTGFVILDLSEPLAPVRRGSVRSPDYAKGVTKRGDILYAMDTIFGINILDVSDPWNPVLAGLWPGGVGNWYLRFRGDLGYLSAGEAGVQILDFSDPVNPSLVGDFLPGGKVAGMNESNGVVIAGYSAATAVLDTSDVENPTLLATIFVNGVSDVDFNGDVAYLSRSGFSAIDMSDPTQPVECNQGDEWTTSSTELRDDILYVTADGVFAGLAVADVSDPCTPVELGTLFLQNSPDFEDVVIVGRRAYCGVDTNPSVAIVDIGNPNQLSLIGQVETLTVTQFLDVDEPYIYVSENAEGFGIYRVPAQGDADWDFDVDRFDYLQFFACHNGPAGDVEPVCDPMDFYDVGQGVDLRDFSLFQENYTGTIEPK